MESGKSVKDNPKRSSLDEDADELKEVFEPEPITIYRRYSNGRGYTWAPGDKCFLSSTPAIIREVKMEGLSQLVRIRMAVEAPLLSRRLVSDHPKWIDGRLLKQRGTIIPELGEHNE